MELQYKQSKAVAVTCLSFMSGDVNNFVVGSEEGSVYTACRHGRYRLNTYVAQCFTALSKAPSTQCQFSLTIFIC